MSGRPHPSHVFPHLASLLHDVQLAREVTPCLTCVLLRSILVCFINPYSWCALTKLKCRSNPNPSRNGFRARSLESHVCETAASPWRGWDAVTFDLDHLSVLSRPRWTRCMSHSCGIPPADPPIWQLRGTREQDVGLCISYVQNACRGFGSSLKANPM